MRILSQVELERTAVLTNLDVPIALLEVTETGLEKSIMDATDSVRQFLCETGLHDYKSQPKGPDFKKVLPTVFVDDSGSVTSTETSFYRPMTKDGDPRVWVYGLKRRASARDIVLLTVLAGRLWVVNLSTTPLDQIANKAGPLDDALEKAFAKKTFIVDELTRALVEVSERGFLPATGTGDTMVGRVLETALGIEANSRKAPDYKGIELKAFRLKSGSKMHSMKRRNLFAKTPDWSRSVLKSSRQLVDEFGYQRDGEWRLYCEVRADKYNSQGLRLEVDEYAGLLHERSNRPAMRDVVVWELPLLEDELAAKHGETFWIGAEARKEGGQESFHYVIVEHTKQPIVEQFGPLVAGGQISLDHLIKRKGMGAHEKGPLFKLDNGSAGLLFPAPRSFSLIEAA